MVDTDCVLDPDTGRFCTVARDVTGRQQAHAALEASEGLRTTLETTQERVTERLLEGVVLQQAVRDVSGRITDFRIDSSNPAVGVISGVAPAEQVAHTLLELFPSHRTNGLFDAYVRVVETGVPFAAENFRYVDPGAAGGPLDQVLDLRAAKLGDGTVVSVRNVTARHRADLEMRRLTAAIRQTADAVIVTDATGAIEYVNPAFERVTGYSSDEVLGQNPRILKSGVQGPAFYAAMSATLASRELVHRGPGQPPQGWQPLPGGGRHLGGPRRGRGRHELCRGQSERDPRTCPGGRAATDRAGARPDRGRPSPTSGSCRPPAQRPT